MLWKLRISKVINVDIVYNNKDGTYGGCQTCDIFFT